MSQGTTNLCEQKVVVTGAQNWKTWRVPHLDKVFKQGCSCAAAQGKVLGPCLKTQMRSPMLSCTEPGD